MRLHVVYGPPKFFFVPLLVPIETLTPSEGYPSRQIKVRKGVILGPSPTCGNRAAGVSCTAAHPDTLQPFRPQT